jgi:hypothetical protein
MAHAGSHQRAQSVENSLRPKQERITVIGDAGIHKASSIQRCAGGLSLAWCLYHPQPLQPRPRLSFALADACKCIGILTATRIKELHTSSWHYAGRLLKRRLCKGMG